MSSWSVLLGLFLTVLASLGVALWSMVEVGRLRRRMLLQEDALLSLRGALSAVCSEETANDQRQPDLDLDRRLRQLTEQQEQLLMRDPELGPYHHAMRLAMKGSSPEELMETCGLTRGEADLLLSLHQSRGPAEG
ncbi:DUF2802 domain-containing protein [Thioalkalivibrio sp.]|uniref:DUF2802 domain-containing protein n=1 Tax=Thioalkalivibrio sp. TaxID=2093813 RepID=UPI00397644BA